VSTISLEQIVSNVWGSAPAFVRKHLYYVSFIGDFRKFTWIIFLKSILMFIEFFFISRNLLNKNFVKKLITMQTDWGGEYEKLNAFFQKKVGITHHMFCPHARQQNGPAERNNHHVVEVRLALLSQEYMPLNS
jgi:hypothetical protein